MPNPIAYSAFVDLLRGVERAARGGVIEEGGLLADRDIQILGTSAQRRDIANGTALGTPVTPGGFVHESTNVLDKLVPPYSVPTYLAIDSKFVFSKRSQAQMHGVKLELLRVATLALKHTTQDFMFYDGVRSEAEQRRLVNSGASQTMHSKHREQADGFGHAMDLVPVNDVGQPVWEWPRIYPIACAVDFAATQLGYAANIRWGGAWDRRLSDFGGDPDAYRKEVEAYANRHAGKDFLDGPHFEWVE